MRTKTLLVTAALSALGVVSTFAQGGVYSVNAVGYVNITVPVGAYSLIANPLIGTNNLLATVLPLSEDMDGTVFFRWIDNPDGSQGYTSAYTFVFGLGWLGTDGAEDTTTTLDPGEAIMFNAQSASGAANQSITFVGEVPQGNLSTPLRGINKKSYVSSQVPQAAPVGGAGVADTLELPAEEGDVIFLWEVKIAGTPPTMGYSEAYTCLGGGSWLDPLGNFTQGPVIPVAYGFVFAQSAGTTIAWTRTFNVN